ncbi:MAG: hypothetical protein AAF891_09825 [Pseudomonadota bacterium]
MSAIIDKLADDLARDAIEAADALGDEQLIMDIAKMLEERIENAAAKLDAS